MERITVKDLKRMDKDWLSPCDVSGILGCAPYSINVQANGGENALPFPYFKIGNRVKIPRLAFIEWCEKLKLK